MALARHKHADIKEFRCANNEDMEDKAETEEEEEDMVVQALRFAH
jgi:hypothetical protein